MAKTTVLCLSLHSTLILCVLLVAGAQGEDAEFDPYKILGVTKSASQAEIKKVYKRLAKEW